MDPLGYATRRRSARPRLSRLSSITRAEDLTNHPLGQLDEGQPDQTGSDTDTADWTFDRLTGQRSDASSHRRSTEDEGYSAEPSDCEDAAGRARDTPPALSARRSISKRLSGPRSGKGRASSSSEEVELWFERSPSGPSMTTSPLRTTSDCEGSWEEAADTSDGQPDGSSNGVSHPSKPAPFAAAEGSDAHHFGKIPLTSLAGLTDGQVTAFPTQIASHGPELHPHPQPHAHKPAGFTDTAHAPAHTKDAGGKPLPKLKGTLERRVSNADPLFMPESPNSSAPTSRVSSPRISTWQEQQQASPGGSVWDRRMQRIGSTKKRPTLDLSQVDLHPSLHEGREPEGATSISADDLQSLQAAVDSVLHLSPKTDAWEGLGNGKHLPGEVQAREDVGWSSAVQQAPEPLSVNGAARFQRRLEDDGVHSLDDLDVLESATKAKLGPANRNLGGAGAISIVQRGNYGPRGPGMGLAV